MLKINLKLAQIKTQRISTGLRMEPTKLLLALGENTWRRGIVTLPPSLPSQERNLFGAFVQSRGIPRERMNMHESLLDEPGISTTGAGAPSTLSSMLYHGTDCLVQ